MSCCCQRPPYVSIRKVTGGVNSTVQWNDRGCRGANKRFLRWTFFKNGRLVHTTAFGEPSDALPIGSGSTFAQINGTVSDIVDFLGTVSVTVNVGDIIELLLAAKNCESEQASSNRLRYQATAPSTACDCTFLTNYQTGLTGNSATLPSGFTAPIFAWRNGLLDYNGNNFTGDNLAALDELMFANLTGCTATIEQASVTGATGNVPVPTAFQGLPITDYLVFRNGLLQLGQTLSGNNMVPNAASDPLDEWMFAKVSGSTAGCKFRSILVSNDVDTSTVNLPSGYTSANQSDWIFVRNGLAQYPVPSSAFGYTVNTSGVLTPVVPFENAQVWIITID